ENPLYFLLEVIVPGAEFSQKLRPAFGIADRSCLEQLVYLAITLRCHRWWPSSLCSHALAARQSSITVSGETWRIAAVSSTPSPPKKRSSITSLCRGWSFDKRPSASSSAI